MLIRSFLEGIRCQVHPNLETSMNEFLRLSSSFVSFLFWLFSSWFDLHSKHSFTKLWTSVFSWLFCWLRVFLFTPERAHLIKINALLRFESFVFPLNSILITFCTETQTLVLDNPRQTSMKWRITRFQLWVRLPVAESYVIYQLFRHFGEEAGSCRLVKNENGWHEGRCYRFPWLLELVF